MRKRKPSEIQRAVIFALVLREARARIGATRMGAFWTLAEPLLHITAFTLLYGTIRGSQTASLPFSIFLFVGLSPFILFRNISLRMMDSLDANRALFSYKQILPIDTFVARTIVEFFVAAIVYLVIALGFGWFGFPSAISHPLEWIIAISLGCTLSFSLGMTFSVITREMPQLKIIIRIAFLPLYLVSGVFFSPSSLPPQALTLLQINPYFHLIELLRSYALPSYSTVQGTSIMYVLSVTLVFLFSSFFLYHIKRRELVRL